MTGETGESSKARKEIQFFIGEFSNFDKMTQTQLIVEWIYALRLKEIWISTEAI